MVIFRFFRRRAAASLAVLLLLNIYDVEMAFGDEWKSRNSAELAFTDNANLSQSGRIADTYYRLSTGNTSVYGEHRVGVNLSFRDYLKESQNDLIALRASDAWRSTDSAWKYTGAVVGQLYPAGSAGNTDTAFDNYGVDISMTRRQEMSVGSRFDFGWGSRSRFYPSFSGRFDENIFGLIDFEHEANPRLVLSADVESGLIFSGLSEYSKFYSSVEGSVDYDLKRGWFLFAHVGVDHSLFLNRTVSAQTAVTRKRGQIVTGQTTTLETQSRVSVGAEVTRRVTPAFDFAFGLNSLTQSSASGLENYSELQFFGRVSYTF